MFRCLEHAPLPPFLHPSPSLPADANNTLAYLPQQSAATSLVSTTPSMNRLISGDYDGVNGAANRTALRAALASFQANVSSVPNLASSAALLANVSSAVVSFRTSGLLNSLDSALASAQTSLAAVPSAAALGVVLSSVQSMLNSLSLTGLQASVASFSVTLSSLPSTAPIRNEVWPARIALHRDRNARNTRR